MLSTVVLLAHFALLASSPAADQKARAESLYAAQRFPEARAVLKTIRASPEFSTKERVEVLHLLARCYLAEDNPAEAEATYVDLLAIDPRWNVPAMTSPKIVEVFNRTKSRIYASNFVGLSLGRGDNHGQWVHLVDPWSKVATLKMFRRLQGAASWREQALPVETDVHLSEPEADETWYLEAYDEAQNRVAHLGTETAPQLSLRATLDKTGPAEPTKARKIGGWAVLGIGAAVLTSAVVLQVASQGSSAQARQEAWADLARGHQERAVSQANWARGLFIGGGITAAAGATVLIVW